MHVRELTLTNVRQFENRTFKFQPGFNLLVGENGAGKSTVLRALRAVLGNRGQTGRRYLLDEDDIRNGSNELEVEAILGGEEEKIIDRPHFTKGLGRASLHTREAQELLTLHYSASLAAADDFTYRGKRRQFRDSSIPSTAEVESSLRESVTGDIRRDGSQRRFGQSRLVERFILDALRRFMPDCISFGWIFEPYDCSIRPGDEVRSEPPPTPRSTKMLRTAVLDFVRMEKNPFRHMDRKSVLLDRRGRARDYNLSRLLLPPYESLLKRFEPTDRELAYLRGCMVDVRLTPRIEIRRQSGRLLLRQMSDGEQRLFTLLADIARHLLLLRQNTRADKIPALVLVDEIDAHLHPKWQRMIVPTLTKVFPSCQFVASTHSPFVIQSVPLEHVTRLDRNRRLELEDQGNSIEDIVEEVQGVKMPQRSYRAEQLEQAAERYFALLQAGARSDSAELLEAERAYREATEPYTADPAVHAFLKIAIKEGGRA